MSIHLESRDLVNTQHLEVGVHGPDGATHLILCTGVAALEPVSDETYIFPVGPQLSKRQFVGVIASGGLSRIQAYDSGPISHHAGIELGANLVSIAACYDDGSCYVQVRVQISSSVAMKKISISYNVSILAELPLY